MRDARLVILTIVTLIGGSTIWVGVTGSTASAHPVNKESNQVAVGDWSVFMPEGNGKSLAVSSCFTCHGLEQVVTLRGDNEFWSSLVWKMVNDNGADLNKDQADNLIQYFAISFPSDLPKTKIPININTGSPATLRLLAPLASHADDIVKARGEKRFDGPDDLTRVPGVTKGDVDKVRNFVTVE